jgi:hypothetical protein
LNKLVKYSFLILLLLFGCAQVTSLNLKKHQFGKIPTKIVWIQVAGLSPEHLALLKFSYPSRDRKSAFEDALCVGSAWDYNLYDVRPDAYAGFLSQMTGKKNIKNSCSDYELKPIWKYVANKKYKVGIFEGELKKEQSISKHSQCKKDYSGYLNETTLWSMNKVKKPKNLFHVNGKDNFKPGEIYYDKSCLNGACFTSLSRNVEGTFNSFQKNTNNYLYIVRNFNYINLLKSNKISEARSELNEINTTLAYFQKLASKTTDMLVLLTSSEVKELDFPKTGKEWTKFEKSSKLLGVKNTKLISSVFASGARAENFCGIYDQSQILSRIFSGAKQQGLEFSIINPFE